MSTTEKTEVKVATGVIRFIARSDNKLYKENLLGYSEEDNRALIEKLDEVFGDTPYSLEFLETGSGRGVHIKAPEILSI